MAPGSLSRLLDPVRTAAGRQLGPVGDKPKVMITLETKNGGIEIRKKE